MYNVGFAEEVLILDCFQKIDALFDCGGNLIGKNQCHQGMGGCGIGHDALDGVVDVDGRVFQLPTPCHGDDCWEGSLRVLDGAMLPGSLGVNPALTIAALALGVSARASSSRSALTVLLAFWFLNCLVAPRAAGDLAEAAHQTPTPVQFQRSMQADLDDRTEQRQLTLGHLATHPTHDAPLHNREH